MHSLERRTVVLWCRLVLIGHMIPVAIAILMHFWPQTEGATKARCSAAKGVLPIDSVVGGALRPILSGHSHLSPGSVVVSVLGVDVAETSPAAEEAKEAEEEEANTTCC